MKRYYVNGWREEDDKELARIMLDNSHNPVGECLDYAASILNRTAKSCQNRWYSIRKHYLKEMKEHQ